MGKFQPGSLNPRWKGGKTKTVDGYIRITAGIFRGKFEHRLIWERAVGPIPEGYDVHHKDEVRTHKNFELRQSIPHRKEVIQRVNNRKKLGLTRKRHVGYPLSSTRHSRAH